MSYRSIMGLENKDIDPPSPKMKPRFRGERAVIRPPCDQEGLAVHRLIARCEPLDGNSTYCNLLQCSHFANTCAVAVEPWSGVLRAFLSAYLIPKRSDTLFVWQVAVAPEARGEGLAKRMILDVLRRPTCRNIRFLEASITSGNQASWNLFFSIARELEAAHRTEPLFEAGRHFENTHETETLLRIGPFGQRVAEKKGT